MGAFVGAVTAAGAVVAFLWVFLAVWAAVAGALGVFGLIGGWMIAAPLAYLAAGTVAALGGAVSGVAR